jgi:hypothetical protein
MWWDRKFDLAKDGDDLERRWWPMLSSDFAPYKDFWEKHIVPLTNRIDPDFKQDDDVWHYFRSDAQIKKAAEEMTMTRVKTH